MKCKKKPKRAASDQIFFGGRSLVPSVAPALFSSESHLRSASLALACVFSPADRARTKLMKKGAKKKTKKSAADKNKQQKSSKESPSPKTKTGDKDKAKPKAMTKATPSAKAKPKGAASSPKETKPPRDNSNSSAKAITAGRRKYKYEVLLQQNRGQNGG